MKIAAEINEISRGKKSQWKPKLFLLKGQQNKKIFF
jgi:hypothetical protein